MVRLSPTEALSVLEASIRSSDLLVIFTDALKRLQDASLGNPNLAAEAVLDVLVDALLWSINVIQPGTPKWPQPNPEIQVGDPDTEPRISRVWTTAQGVLHSSEKPNPGYGFPQDRTMRPQVSPITAEDAKIWRQYAWALSESLVATKKSLKEKDSPFGELGTFMVPSPSGKKVASGKPPPSVRSAIKAANRSAVFARKSMRRWGRGRPGKKDTHTTQ